ncbi:MAG: TetR/AcrR family transcriptional regulator [Gammaproteobacteria bacterium]|nr:TetR/AcrR family transcriptional regulator [Gammaproteobacteria bacterium]
MALQERIRSGPASKRSMPRGERRRGAILQALHDCIIEKGYPKTTLADVARAAGMSPSHLLYYFAGMDAILTQYFGDVARRITGRLDGFRTETPEQRINLIAELFFSGEGVTRSEIGFMLECFGVAVHDRKLHAEKAALDRYCKAYLRRLFEQSPHGVRGARDSAEVAYALLVGLRTAEYFDKRLGADDARRLFHAEMLNLAGLRSAE